MKTKMKNNNNNENNVILTIMKMIMWRNNESTENIEWQENENDR